MSKHKVKRYDGEDGSEVEVGGPNPAPETAMTELPPAPEAQATSKPASFKDAFAAARRAGDKVFEYNGKKFTTDLAKPAAAAAPMASGPGRAPSPAKKPAAPYETPYDRMNRTNREGAAAKASTADETARLRQRNMPASKFDASKVNPKTLLPAKGYAKGGSISSASSRADGIAQRGKTRGTIFCGGGMAKGKK